MTVAKRPRRNCCRCSRKAASTERIIHDGTKTRFDLCPQHGGEFHRTFGRYIAAAAFEPDTCCACCDRRGSECESFTVAGRRVELFLCPGHADRLQAERGMWLQLGVVEVEEMAQIARRVEGVRDLKAVAPERFVKPAQNDHKHRDTLVRWKLTDHAWQRLAERTRKYGFTRDEVLDALDAGVYYEELGALGIGRYVRGNVSVLVNKEQGAVITVMPADWGVDELAEGA